MPKTAAPKALRPEQVVSGTELAQLTGYTAQRVNDYMAEDGAPAPWKSFPFGRVWDKDAALAHIMKERKRGPAKGTPAPRRAAVSAGV